jgi:hypothetical protein
MVFGFTCRRGRELSGNLSGKILEIEKKLAFRREFSDLL